MAFSGVTRLHLEPRYFAAASRPWGATLPGVGGHVLGDEHALNYAPQFGPVLGQVYLVQLVSISRFWVSTIYYYGAADTEQ